MALVHRDISRSRKAYSYYRPRPIYRAVATEIEMNNVNEAVKKVAELTQLVATINASTDDIIWNETPLGNIDGSNVTFTLAYTPELNGKVLIFINGVLQEHNASSADFSLNGRTITFSSPPRVNSKILVTYAKLVI